MRTIILIRAQSLLMFSHYDANCFYLDLCLSEGSLSVTTTQFDFWKKKEKKDVNCNLSRVDEMFLLMLNHSRISLSISPALTLQSLMAVSWAERVSLNAACTSEAFSAS